jgi:3',5'-cyclic AMP phosphodiesterase CpdA
MFVLAHLSDPHLGPLPKPRLSELIGKRATGFLNWQRKRRFVHRGDVLARIVADLAAQAPDHIAVTGDLANISLAGEYAPARAWLESLGSPANVTLVPGNHDAYARRTARHAQRHWGEYMRGDDGDQCTNEGLCRVVLIHHPPVSKPSRHFKRLVDGAALCETLARHGAELVIHGHDHVHSLTFVEGPHRRIPVVGVPSASEAPPGKHDPAGYNLYRVDGGAGAWRTEVISRGISPDGANVIEIKRTVLSGS